MTRSTCSGDREKKYTQLFASAKLDGAKMSSHNGHSMGVIVRNIAQGAAWADDLEKVLKGMMDPAAANDTKCDESAEMEEIRNKTIQLACKNKPDGTALLGWAHVAAGNHKCEDDEESMRSNALSLMSTVHSDHSKGRSEERNISTREIQEAKANGASSLAIHFNGNMNMEQAKHETGIFSWGSQLTQVFEGLTAGDAVEIVSNKGDRRLEIVLHGSEKRGPKIKKWLTAQKYFEVWNRRITFRMVQEQSKWLVVVEGRIAPNVVGMVTVLRRDGNARICEFRHVKWLGKQLLDLIINKGDGADEVNEFKEILSKHARFIGGRSTWVIGEFPGQNLSEWHISENRERPITLLMWAAKSGSLRIVESLVNDYNCNVTVAQKIVTEDTGTVSFVTKDTGVTALHVAAYCGHAAVVDFLLQSGADKNQVNTLYKDITPLDSAKRGLVLHPEMSEQFNVIIDKLESWE